MTSKEMLDYIINSERWGEPTCVEEATKNHEIEKWIRNQIEINEILKKRLNIKIPYGSVNVISVNNDDDYLLFEVELKEHTKIEEWLDGED